MMMELFRVDLISRNQGASVLPGIFL